MVQSSLNPPLLRGYSELLCHSDNKADKVVNSDVNMEECELPLIDLSGLTSESQKERAGCATAICKASSEWGFFQVVNHGISNELLSKMRKEQVKLFDAPFESKQNCGLFDNSYSWGNKTATSPNQFSWSEAFHVPLDSISDKDTTAQFSSLREVMAEYASAMQEVARALAGVLVMKMGHNESDFYEKCDESSCFLRLNRYPPCPNLPKGLPFGLIPHTDSDFLTILHQDQVGGLQLMKDSKWVAVKPNQNALIVNIGDLFQAWSNDVYKSVEHKVMVNQKAERYSIAYFLCPSYETVIGSCKQPSVYKNFTFGEYRGQIKHDVKTTGQKVGLPRFLLSN